MAGFLVRAEARRDCREKLLGRKRRWRGVVKRAMEFVARATHPPNARSLRATAFAGSDECRPAVRPTPCPRGAVDPIQREETAASRASAAAPDAFRRLRDA